MAKPNYIKAAFFVPANLMAIGTAALYAKMNRTPAVPDAEDTRDLGALKYVSEARGP